MGNKASNRRSLVQNGSAEPQTWEIGSRYEVKRNCVLYDQQKLAKKIGDVKPKEVVLLLDMIDSEKGTFITGLVVPPPRQDRPYAGWMLLQGRENLQSLRTQKAEGSWEKQARYRVRHPALMREDISIDSAEVCEVTPGTEVLILDIDVYAEQNSTSNVRLRLLVSTDDKQLGWISPETGPGNKLLDPVNMLGLDAVKVHKENVRRGSHASVMMRWSERGKSGGATSLQNIPWEAGGRYRVLEKLDFREQPKDKSKRLCRLPVGAFVTITELQMTECKHLGWCPFAKVEADSSGAKKKKKLKHSKGWIRCSGTDGRDLIDTRDQLEFHKIQARLSQVLEDDGVVGRSSTRSSGKKVTISDMPAERKEVSEKNEESSYVDEDFDEDFDEEYEESEEEVEDYTDNASELTPEAEQSERPPEGELVDPKLPATITQHAQLKEASNGKTPEEEAREQEQEFAKKLQSMEIGAKDDKLVDDKTAPTDEKYCCGCNCGAY